MGIGKVRIFSIVREIWGTDVVIFSRFEIVAGVEESYTRSQEKVDLIISPTR